MSGGHTHALYSHQHGPLHHLAPQCKLAATLAFMVLVVATPREAFWVFGGYAAIVVAVAAFARIPPTFLARRLLIEVPFLAFAIFLPIVGGGERTDVLGVSLSESGLWAAWSILAKGSLGVGATIVLAATTPVSDILQGLQRLRVPGSFVLIAGLMVRYLEVITDELSRMRVARLSRADDPRWFWQARAVASTAGSLFIRSYERGERVHDAMLSRGYSGALPDTSRPAPRRDWLVALTIPAVALTLAASAWVVA